MPQVTGDDGTASGFAPGGPFGVWGDSGLPSLIPGAANGVVGSSKEGSGVAGFTLAKSNRAAGVYGQGPQVGVAGGVDGSNTAPGQKVGVYGTGSSGRGLGGIGVEGESDTRAGVLGVSRSGPGASGFSTTAAGVLGVSTRNVGLLGISNGTGVIAIGGASAGFFFGDVEVTGNLFKGGGGFQIDHPLHPKNRYLRHSFVESAEMKNVYDGIAVCDSKGKAVVELPDWFEALNENFRYQLTPIGASAPNLFIASPIKRHRFTIAGGARGLQVSWQITGVRKDAWAKSHRVVVEDNKPAGDRGRYLHPETYGQSLERSVERARYMEAQQYLASEESGSKPRVKKKPPRR